MKGYLYISFKNDSLTSYKFYDNIEQIMIEYGFNINEEYMRQVRVATFTFNNHHDFIGAYVILLTGNINPSAVDTSRANHAYPLLKQVYREMQLNKIGIDE
jgi:hypothetical protein